MGRQVGFDVGLNGDMVLRRCPECPSSASRHPEKRERPAHPFSNTSKRADGSYGRGQNKEERQHISESDFIEEITSYLTDLSNADCCISVRSETVNCNCLSFLSDKPRALDAVAKALKFHFDSNESVKRCSLVRDYKHAFQLTEVHSCGADRRPLTHYPLPLFVLEINKDADNIDDEDDIFEAMRHGNVCCKINSK